MYRTRRTFTIDRRLLQTCEEFANNSIDQSRATEGPDRTALDQIGRERRHRINQGDHLAATRRLIEGQVTTNWKRALSQPTEHSLNKQLDKLTGGR